MFGVQGVGGGTRGGGAGAVAFGVRGVAPPDVVAADFVRLCVEKNERDFGFSTIAGSGLSTGVCALRIDTLLSASVSFLIGIEGLRWTTEMRGKVPGICAKSSISLRHAVENEAQLTLFRHEVLNRG